MTQPTAPAVQLSDAQRFGEVFRTAGHDLGLTPKQVWIVVDSAFFAHAAGCRNVDTVLAMADIQTVGAAVIALFYLYLLDLHSEVNEPVHDAVLRAIDPEFDPELMSE